MKSPRYFSRAFLSFLSNSVDCKISSKRPIVLNAYVSNQCNIESIKTLNFLGSSKKGLTQKYKEKPRKD